MNKGKIIVIGLVVGIFLIASVVSAGGRISSGEEVIGTPPESMARVSNISRHRGDGRLFYLPLQFGYRVFTHYIEPGDEKPGPGWGVSEGHNIGNAPTTPVIGKQLDRSGRGKLEFVGDVLGRIEKHSAEQKQAK